MSESISAFDGLSINWCEQDECVNLFGSIASYWGSDLSGYKQKKNCINKIKKQIISNKNLCV